MPATFDEFFAQLQRDAGTAKVAVAASPAPPTVQTPQPASVDPSATSTDNPITGLEPQPSTPAFELAPATAKELQQAGASYALAQGARPKVMTPVKGGPSSFERAQDLMSSLGARPGVHFDFESGLPFISRLAAEREPTPEEQFAAYQHEYGAENVRKNKFGQAVVTTTDEKGRTVDKLANPIGLDMGDLATFAAATPELAGSIVPLILSRGATLGPGVLKALGTLALSTGGAELAGTAKDMFLRWVEGRDVQPAEIAERRTIETGGQLIGGALLGLGAKAVTTAISPFNSAGRLQFKAQEAVKYFKDKYGIVLPQTAGEKTGSQILQAAEGMEAAKPGSRTAFAKFRSKQLEQVNQLRDIATGSISDTEAAGKRVLTSLKGELAPLEYDIQSASQEAEKAATEAIKTTIGTPVDKVKVGNAIDLGAKARKSGFDLVNTANYDAFYNNPKATERIIGGAPLKNAVDSLIEDLPAIEQDVQVPTGVLGPTGQPTFTQGTKVIPVSTPVRSTLEDISRKLENNGRLSINDLKGIRTDVDNAIKTGEAVPGVKEGRLKQYYKSLTEAIDQGLKDINDPQLTKAWETATDYYKANVGKFERAGIQEIFRDPSNALGPSKLVERALDSPDTYAAYKEFFGATSPQLKGIHQATKDDILDLGRIGKSLDAASFATKLDALERNSPQLLEDAFGVKQAAFLRTEAKTILAAQGQTLPKDELAKALSSGTLSGDSLRNMMTAQTRRDTAYANTLVREISAGTVSPDKIKPTEVVDKFVFRKSTQPSDLSELVSQLEKAPDGADRIEDLRRLSFKRVLDDATVTGKTGDRILSSKLIEQTLADPNVDKKLQTVLGPDSYQDLVRLKDFLKPGEIGLGAYAAAGGLAGGSQIEQMVERGSLKYVTRAVKNLLIATVYTSEPIKNLLTNQVLDQEGAALRVNAAIASAPFIKALMHTYTKEAATAAMVELKGATDQMVMRDPASGAQGVSKSAQGVPFDQMLPKFANPDDFLKHLQNQ